MTSRREARLWLLAGGLTVLIFATLGIAPDLARVLRDRDAVDTTFFVVFLVLVATIVLYGLGRGASLAQVALAVAFGAVATLVVLRSAIPPAERTHLVEYAALALVVHAALEERGRADPRVRLPAVAAVFLAGGVGVVDELVQLLLPNRVFDPVDIAFNVSAATSAMVLTVALRRLRRQR